MVWERLADMLKLPTNSIVLADLQNAVESERINSQSLEDTGTFHNNTFWKEHLSLLTHFQAFKPSYTFSSI